MPAPLSNLTQSEARERSRLVEGLSYFIEWDLTGDEARHPFQAQVEFTSSEPGAATFIDLEVAEVAEMIWNGAPLPGSAYDGQRIALPLLSSRNSLLVRGQALYGRSGLGLHRSTDPVDGAVYVYSDFEPYEAHRSFPCFDQPDLKGSFRFRLRVPEEWLVVGTDPGHPEEVDPKDGCRWWSFPPTMPLSPYVLGLAAGPFHHLERQHGSIPLGLYCASSLAPYLDADELFDITARGLDYFERVFRVPYPFAKYDQVFCPEKADGAMESPGCVTLTDDYLWRGQATVRQRSIRADTILHEMSHMWFGDLVTMRWWDDLWLNESFATLMAVFAVDQATDFDDAWVGFATANLQLSREQDQLGTSHPVVTPVPDVESVRANFDHITYEKGAAALRQLVAYVGVENFFAAIHHHLTQHREANADLGDLTEALALSSGRDVQGWSKAWLETVGINLLRCEIHSSTEEVGAKVAAVTVIQGASPAQPVLRPHRIRLGNFDWVGDTLARVGTVELDVEGPRTDVEELAASRRHPLLLPNDGGLSYAKIRLDPLSLATIEANLSSVAEPLARALIWDSCWDMVRDLELPAHRYAQMVAQHLSAESDTTLVGVVLANFRAATRRYGSPHRGQDLEAHMADAAWEVLSAAQSDSDQQATWLRAFIRLAASKEQVERCRALLAGRHLPEGINLDAELRWALVSGLAARGAAGSADIARAVEADPSSGGLMRAAGARAARPTAAAKKWAWSRLAAKDATMEEVHIVGSSLGGRLHEQLLLPYVRKLAQLFDDALSRHGGEFAVHLGTWLPYSLPPSQELADSCRDNLEREDLDPVLRRIFANILENTERLLRARLLDQTDGELATGSGLPLTTVP